MDEEPVQIRALSPVPDDVLQRIPTGDPDAFRRWLAKVSFHVNSTAFINKLPVDLLVDIMQDVMKYNRSQAARSSWPFHCAVTIDLLMTCRHWYMVAIASPSLWTALYTAMPLPLLGAYLRRSRGADLSLNTSGSEDIDIPEAIMQKLSPHFDRITHMTTLGGQFYLDDCTLTRLSSLHVIEEEPTMMPRPLVCINKQFPRLTMLTVNSVERLRRNTCVYIEGVMPSLTSLTLGSIAFDTWDSLFNMLRHCPALRCLVLANCVVHSPSAPPTRHPVALNNLEELVLQNLDQSTSRTPHLMAHLSLPHLTRFTVTTLDVYDAPYELPYGLDYRSAVELFELRQMDQMQIVESVLPYRPYLHALASINVIESVVTTENAEVRVTAIIPDASRTKSFTFTYRHTFGWGLYEPRLRHQKLTVGVQRTQEKLMHALGELFSALPVTVLRMHVEDSQSYPGSSFSTAEAWTVLHAAFPALEEIDVTSPYLDLFRHMFIDSDTYNEAQAAWPGLKYVYLECTNEAGPREDVSETFIGLVATMMTDRLATAGKLQQLDITSTQSQLPDNFACTHMAQLRGATEELTYTLAGN